MSEEELQQLMEEYNVSREQAEKMLASIKEGLSAKEAFNLLEEEPS